MRHDAETFGLVVRTIGTILLLIAAWRFMLIPTMNDRFRQRLFEIRRSALLLVADGRLRHDEQAYCQLRDTINGLLRFAERVTFARVLLSNRMMAKNIEAYIERAEQAIAQIKDPNVRAEFLAHRERVDIAIARHVVFTSPWLWLPLAALVGRHMGARAVTSWLKAHRPTGIEAEAECFSNKAALA
jgi:hypothetical protein